MLPSKKSPNNLPFTLLITLIVFLLPSFACSWMRFTPLDAPTIAAPTRLNPPFITVVQHTLTPTPPPSPPAEIIPSATPVSGSNSSCDGLLAFRWLSPEERTKDLFEHHAQGIFLILHLGVTNFTAQPVQIYSGDYTLMIPLQNSTPMLSPHKAATNYLYIVRGDSFYQDKIPPASAWQTYLAFDINPQWSAWQLKISPGSEINSPLCEVILSP